MGRIVKTANQIAAQIEKWFLSYHGKGKPGFNGSETFTIFHHLHSEKQNELIKRMDLNKQEIPVLVLSSSNNQFIVNTTERFIRMYNSGVESLFYTDFEGHKGYRSFAVEQPTTSKIISIKTDDSFSEFGLKTKAGQVIYWVIPTGRAGFAFWNVTKKCELIGRKYSVG
jgi:hypothetical protein